MSKINDLNGEEIHENDSLEDKDGNKYLCGFRRGRHVIVHAPTCRAEEEGECKTDYLNESCVNFYGLVKSQLS